MELVFGTIYKFLSDVKVWIALTLLPFFQNFYGPSWSLMGIIFTSALADIVVGYLKNKRLKQEKFKLARVLEKLKQIGAVFFVLTLANFNDPFFMHYGFNRFTMGVNVCVFFGIWQFLHTLENLTQWLPDEVKESIKNKIKEKLSLNNKNDKE